MLPLRLPELQDPVLSAGALRRKTSPPFTFAVPPFWLLPVVSFTNVTSPGTAKDTSFRLSALKWILGVFCSPPSSVFSPDSTLKLISPLGGAGMLSSFSIQKSTPHSSSCCRELP